MPNSKLISLLEEALVEAAKSQSKDDIANAKRLIRRLERSVEDSSSLNMRGMLEELGLPDPDDVPTNDAEKKEWDDQQFVIFENWLKDEFMHVNSLTRTQQELIKKFGFRGDLYKIFVTRHGSTINQLYSVQLAPYCHDGIPELTFIKKS